MVMLGIIHTCTALLYKLALTEISSNYFDGIKVRDPCPFSSVLSLVGSVSAAYAVVPRSTLVLAHSFGGKNFKKSKLSVTGERRSS